ncbi:MAG TPA: ACT domain-containing protein [Phycicoccus sp.]|nr:ACT domain-containing protein [Phycicoccus sp.]HQK31008.1 ACT domain-containing protein [Phycicoccus sp.]HQY98096.1 ACT domain-containing protein [Phycicoccus sp.]HRA44820.1 ACT domain-containing protein [Phycicoccus sp.]
MSEMPLHLMAHPEDVVVARLGPAEQPRWEWQRGPFASLTVTADETSIVTLAEAVPVGVATEGPFRVVEVAGPLEFGMWGVMAEILAPLVAAHISVLAMSTFDTDWILVKAEEITAAGEAWRRAGLIFTPTSLSGSLS